MGLYRRKFFDKLRRFFAKKFRRYCPSPLYIILLLRFFKYTVHIIPLRFDRSKLAHKIFLKFWVNFQNNITMQSRLLSDIYQKLTVFDNLFSPKINGNKSEIEQPGSAVTQSLKIYIMAKNIVKYHCKKLNHSLPKCLPLYSFIFLYRT